MLLAELIFAASTHDQDVFSFYGDGRFCEGFEEVLLRYRELVPQLRLSGPTSFAPVIEMAMSIVDESRGQYHVLLIIADGQVNYLPLSSINQNYDLHLKMGDDLGNKKC